VGSNRQENEDIVLVIVSLTYFIALYCTFVDIWRILSNSREISKTWLCH